MKKLFIILATAMLFISANLNAQVFQNTIGKANFREYGESITQPIDSTYLIAGDYTFDVENYKPYITHLRKDGSIDWSKKIFVPNQSIFQSTSRAEAVKASLRPDGYIMLINMVTEFFLVRLSNSGTITWARQFKLASAERVKPSYDNTGALTGFFILARKSTVEPDAIIIKTGTTGNTIWQKSITHNTPGTTYKFADMQVTSDGGCIATGNLYQNLDISFPVLFRISSIGTVLWGYGYTFTPGGEKPSKAEGVTVTNSGFAVTGFDGNGNNLTFTTSSAGTINWAFKYSNSVSPFMPVQGSSIIADATGNLIIACRSIGTSSSAGIIKLSPGGGVLFAKKFPALSSYFNDINLTRTGTYCAVGGTGLGTAANVLVVNISSLGSIAAACRPQSVVLNVSPTFKKLLVFPAYGVINETIANISVSAHTINILTEQDLCDNSQTTKNVTASKESSNNLQVANDMAGQRVAVKWIAKDAGNTPYEVVLYNSFGQPVNCNKIFANQTAYIPMSKMQSGIYSVALKQNSQMVAQQKVVWVK